MTEFPVIPVLQLHLTPFFDQNPQNWISYKLRIYIQTNFATLVHWAVETFLAAAAASTIAIAHSRISINRLIPSCATVCTFLTLEEAPLRGVSVLLSYLSSLSHPFCVLIVYWINNPPGLTIPHLVISFVRLTVVIGHYATVQYRNHIYQSIALRLRIILSTHLWPLSKRLSRYQTEK